MIKTTSIILSNSEVKVRNNIMSLVSRVDEENEAQTVYTSQFFGVRKGRVIYFQSYSSFL